MARHRLILAFSIVAVCAFAVQANPYPTTDPDVETASVVGPGGLVVKPYFSVGSGACQPLSASVPLFCESPSLSVSGAGYHVFDTRTWSSGSQDVSVWAQYNQDGHPCGTATTTWCGFAILLCNDRDLDDACTNVGATADELVHAYSQEPGATPGGAPDCSTVEKDDKDCGDPTDAEIISACLTPPTSGWGSGKVTVYVAALAGTQTGNMQGVMAVGTFDLYVKHTADSTCSPSSNPPPPSYTRWLH